VTFVAEGATVGSFVGGVVTTAQPQASDASPFRKEHTRGDHKPSSPATCATWQSTGSLDFPSEPLGTGMKPSGMVTTRLLPSSSAPQMSQVA
jgi:hypothetical protein